MSWLEVSRMLQAPPPMQPGGSQAMASPFASSMASAQLVFASDITPALPPLSERMLSTMDLPPEPLLLPSTPLPTPLVAKPKAKRGRPPKEKVAAQPQKKRGGGRPRGKPKVAKVATVAGVQTPPPALLRAKAAVAQAVANANADDVASSSESEPSDPDTGSESDDVEEVEVKNPDGPPEWTDETLDQMFAPATDVRGWQPPIVDPASTRYRGPRNIFSSSERGGICTPTHLFSKFWPDELLQSIASASTAFSHNKRGNKGVDYTKDDILRLLTCMVLMGVVQLPRFEMYWATPTRQQLITTLVPTHAEFARFCVDCHLVDTSVYTATEQKAKNKLDSFWKLGDIEDKLNTVFMYMRVCNYNFTLDEFTVPFRGRHRARQHNKCKPWPYHLKGFAFNEAYTGYCMGLYMYRGKDEKRPKDVPATAWPAKHLLQMNPELWNRGMVLWADNWFSGIPIINVCTMYGVGYCGITKTNRISKAFIDTKTASKGWDRGHLRVRKSVNVAGATPVWCYQWQDRKVVSVLTTIESPLGTITRKTVDKNTKVYTPHVFPCPAIIGAYNAGKVGTDRMDQQVSAYYKNRRLRWHLKVLVHFFYIALNNAHITWRDHQKITIKQSPFLDFLMEVMVTPGMSKRAVHTPMGRGMESKGNKTKFDHRRTCVQCRKKTNVWCSHCKVFLHINTVNTDYTCWSDHHQHLKD